MSANRDGIVVKGIGPLTVENDERGEVTAIVATIGVVDRDGDVFLPGSIREGTKVKLSDYSHSIVLEGAPPAGLGAISVKGDDVILRGRFFMSTQRGAESFRTVKELGEDGEWSVGFPKVSVKTASMTPEWRAKGAERLIAEAVLVEASPVFRGAGIGTRTLAVKEEKPGDPDPDPSPPPEEIAAKEKADAEAKAEQERADAEARAAIGRKEAERKLEAQEAGESAHGTLLRLRRLGYIR